MEGATGDGNAREDAQGPRSPQPRRGSGPRRVQRPTPRFSPTAPCTPELLSGEGGWSSVLGTPRGPSCTGRPSCWALNGLIVCSPRKPLMFLSPFPLGKPGRAEEQAG